MITDIVLGGHIFFLKIYSFFYSTNTFKSIWCKVLLTVDIEQRTKHTRFLQSLNSCDWRETKKQIITVISSGDKCYFRNKQDYVTSLGRGATLNRMKASLWR